MKYLTPLGWEIYGPASDAAVEIIRQAAEAAGVELTMGSRPLGGFLRTASG